MHPDVNNRKNATIVASIAYYSCQSVSISSVLGTRSLTFPGVSHMVGKMSVFPVSSYNGLKVMIEVTKQHAVSVIAS